MRALIVAFCLLASPAMAVNPDEVLADPTLETRARAISLDLRCPVCSSETIDDSNAPISRSLRLAVRERLVAGDSDAEVVDYVVQRYGDYVLYKPRVSGSGLMLWLAGPAMLLGGGALAYMTTRRRAAAPEAAVLSDADRARLDDLLRR